MKYKRVLGIFLIVSLLVSLCLVTLPASPALAWYDISTSPLQGKVGDTITLYGSAFGISTAGSNPAMIYFSSTNYLVGQSIDTGTSAKTVTLQIINEIPSSGAFTTTFVVPSKFNDNSSILPGTYYLYSCQPPTSLEIRNRTVFTVTGGTLTLNTTSGSVDSDIQITGSSFATNSLVEVKFDGQSLSVVTGNPQTDSTGAFFVTVTIPPGEAGAHNVFVTVAGNTISTPFTIIPDMTISPQSGKAGDSVAVSGAGFTRRSDVSIYFNSDVVGLATADTYGSFSTAIVVPSGLAPDEYAIEAEDENANTASKSFLLQATQTTTTSSTTSTTSTTTTTTTTSTTTTPPTSTTTTSPGSIINPEDTYAVGAGIIISGTGMKPDTEISIKFDGKQIASVATTPQGLLIAPVTVPVAPGGSHVISASDGATTIEVPIVIESVPPPVPSGSSPAAGSQASLPLSFKWGGVTDPSSPVTYDFQLSASSTFAEGTVIISKTGLTSTSYTLTEAEQAIVTARNITYYWRVDATDAASNKSSWSAGMSFTVAEPFKFTGWPLYTILGIAALLIFAIGYLLGRRTAFRF